MDSANEFEAIKLEKSNQIKRRKFNSIKNAI